MSEKKSLYILAFIYFAGIAGISVPSLRHYVVPLTPWIILITLCVALIYQKNIKPVAWILLLLTGIAGFLVEVAGVRTGLIFGEYSYGHTLGPGMWTVPWIIGINWMALTFYTLQIRIPKIRSGFLNALVSASLMTFFDYILEPTAVKLGFWSWKHNEIPLQNYLAWFVIAFAFQWIFHLTGTAVKPGPGRYIFIIQLVFFTALLLIL